MIDCVENTYMFYFLGSECFLSHLLKVQFGVLFSLVTVNCAYEIIQ